MAQRILRPLDYGAMLDELFDMYKKNFVLLAGITGIIYLPATMLYNYATTALRTHMTINRNPSPADIQGLIISGIFTMVVMILYFSLTFVVAAAITWAISKVYLGDKVTIMQSYRSVVKKIVPFTLTMTIASLIVLAGFVLLCIPGLIAILFTSFVSESFVIEGKQYVDAIKRSFELVRKEWVKVLVVGLLTYILSFIVSGVMVSPFLVMQALSGNAPMSASMSILQGFVSGIAQTLIMPIQVIAYVLLYYDIRIRKEGFDIEMLAAGMENQTLSK